MLVNWSITMWYNKLKYIALKVTHIAHLHKIPHAESSAIPFRLLSSDQILPIVNMVIQCRARYHKLKLLTKLFPVLLKYYS